MTHGRKQAPRRKKPKNPPSKDMHWVAGVAEGGEMYLQRREVRDPADAVDSRLPFAQGLTFVARRWRNIMNAELQAVGQSHARWGALFWIDVFGDRLNQTRLAERMGLEQPTLGRVLRELEAEGLIRRRAPRGDRRARVIELTPASAPLMRRINRIQDNVRAKLLKDIAPAEFATCLDVFAKILDNMDRHAGTDI
jgi:MarR family transcriptional regulator, transcriptional regulator for hemolysin